MKILFAHRFFPTQMRHLAAALAADPANEVVAVCHPAGGDPLHTAMPPGGRIRAVSYADHMPNRRFGVPKIVSGIAPDLCAGLAVHEAMKALQRAEGFRPDVIVANTLWGESLFLRELFPDVPMLGFLDMYFDGREARFRSDRQGAPGESPAGAPDLPMLARNAALALSLTRIDRGVAALHWQRTLFPAEFHPKIEVIHEGVDTGFASPGAAGFAVPGTGLTLTRDDEVVSFAARHLEALRGFDAFAAAVPEILRRRPNAHVVIVGSALEGDPLLALPAGETPLTQLRAALGPRLSAERLHVVPRLAHPELIGLFRVASAHVYLTHPFILSWSMLEAMACGTVVVGSDNPPVTEVIEHGRNGLLADLFDPTAIADRVVSVLAAPDRRAALAAAGRRTVLERYDLHGVCLPRQLDLIRRLTAGREPPAA